MTDLTMWWPHPDSFSDLTVEDTDNGYSLSAPDDTECAAWLSYWSQDEEHHVFFEQEFIKVLFNHIKTLENDGETQSNPVGRQSDSEQTENVSAGSLT